MSNIVFLIGGSGFVGRNISKQLKLSSKSLIELNSRDSVDHIIEQIQNISPQIKSKLTHSACIISAASGVNLKLDNSGYEFNSIHLPAIAKKLYTIGIRNFIYLGSCFEYGLTGNNEEFLNINSSLSPVEDYGRSKRDGFKNISSWADAKSVNLSYIRLFQLFGHGESKHRLYSGLSRAIAEGADFQLNDPSAIRDFSEVSYVSKAIVDHLDRLHSLQILNLCSGIPLSLFDFSSFIWEAKKGTGEIKFGQEFEIGVYRRLVGLPDIQIGRTLG
jgi:nucleoside-diphosphate-sugar epimerase